MLPSVPQAKEVKRKLRTRFSVEILEVSRAAFVAVALITIEK